MFERWRTFELTKDHFGDTVAAIGDALKKLGVSDKEAESAKMLVEHIYSLQLSKRPEVSDKVKLRKRFGDISLRLETKGDEYNPLQMLEEWHEDDPDYERTIILKSKKEQLSYAHKNGLNIVTIRVHEAGNKQIRYTLLAMVLGILAGAVLKGMVSPETIEMLNKNVVNSIRLIRSALAPGQSMPSVRIGHGLYTPRLNTVKGRQLLKDLRESGTVLEFQITSNVRLNNLSSVKSHPLRRYLDEDVLCVQGTDGAAIYGTSPIDEQLALERLLELSDEEIRRMAETDHRLCEEGVAAFKRKEERWENAYDCSPADVADLYRERIRKEENGGSLFFNGGKGLLTQEVLQDRIRELPPDGLPVVVMGGSFNPPTRAHLYTMVAAMEEGIAIPEPDSIDDYSGQFKLRIPKTLHRQLALQSKREGVSMNQYCVYLLSQNSAVHA